MYSLQKKLTRNLIINMLLVMLTLLIILYFSTRHILFNYVSTRLQHDSDSLITALAVDSGGTWKIDPLRMSTVYNRVHSGHYYRLKSDDREVVSRSMFDSDFPDVPPMPSQTHQIIDAMNDEIWLTRYQRINKGGIDFDIWISEDIAPIQQELIRYTAYALILVLAITVLLIYLQQMTLRRSFQVFEALRQNLEKIRLQQIENAGIEPPLEIMPLIEEIERLVATLQNRIDRTRHSIGNLAHELKRPIQLLTLQANADNEQIIQPLQSIQDIINRELRRARISGTQTSARDFDPGLEMTDLVSVIEKLYPSIEISISIPEQTHKLNLDRDDMLELMGNLLDNSAKFARRQVRASFCIHKDNIEFHFEDDGPGLDQQQIDRIKQRGVRLDESKEGHGIGLSICQEILDSYRGRIEYERSELGGLNVTVSVPLRRRKNTPR